MRAALRIGISAGALVLAGTSTAHAGMPSITLSDLAFLEGMSLAVPHDDAAPQESLHDARERFEREYILRALAAQQGNISRTAEVLGVERSNLYRKMRAFGIAPTRRAEGEEEPA